MSEPSEQRAEIQNLKDLAIYLEGMKQGKGNLLPLGTIVLDDLWKAIRELERERKREKILV